MTMPTFDDPRLTAYALGELDGADAVEIEALMAANPDVQQFVDDVRSAASALESEYAAEPASALEEPQRERIKAVAVAPKRTGRVAHFALITAGMAAAIVAMISFLASVMSLPDTNAISAASSSWLCLR